LVFAVATLLSLQICALVLGIVVIIFNHIGCGVGGVLIKAVAGNQTHNSHIAIDLATGFPADIASCSN
jgi:hypothetical protein